MNDTAWLAQRAALAVALMIGFHVLAVGVALGLLWIPYAEWMYLDRVHGKIAFFCVATAGALLWAVVPRPDTFEPPGPRLEEASHRELFAAIRDVAAATKQAMPTDVFLVNEVNAWVTHRGGIMGFGSHRVMGLGLPLLQGLTISQLKAVLAHEFGHYAAGDVKLGPWIYKTRAAIGRTLAGLRESWLSFVFEAYGRMFLRLTHAISREQEFMADALAARTVHPAAMAAALQRTEGLAPAFTSYWRSEVVPALNAGCLPPIATGFHRFLGVEHVSAALSRIVETAAAHGESDAFDTHPPLKERLAAIARLPQAGSVPADDPPAATLLPDVEGHARRLLEFAAGAERCRQLRRVEWEHLTTVVYPKNWRDAAAQFGPFLAKFTTDTIPSGRKAFAAAGAELADATLAEEDDKAHRAAQVLAIGVAVVLLEAGAAPESGPGRPMLFHLSGATMDPFTAIQLLAAGKLSQADWQAQCRAIGIAGRPLGPAAAV